MQYKIEEAGEYLKDGEFEKAKNIFSNLLDNDPQNPEFISGFFISSYWDNRIESIFNSKEGKERASRLVQLFDEFEKEIINRNIQKNIYFKLVTQCVLGEASSQFRKAYQKEGMIGLESLHLIQLASCLMKTGDYKNAKEILDYSKSFLKSSNEIRYLEAECLYHLGDEKQSRIFYREAMLIDPTLIKFEMVDSLPLKHAIGLIDPQMSENDFKEYLPVFCLEKNYLPEIRLYTDAEIQKFMMEISRLEESLNSKVDKYSFKVKCRLTQLYVTIVDISFGKYQDLKEEATVKLNLLHPGFLENRKIG